MLYMLHWGHVVILHVTNCQALHVIHTGIVALGILALPPILGSNQSFYHRLVHPIITEFQGEAILHRSAGTSPKSRDPRGRVLPAGSWPRYEGHAAKATRK